MKKISFLLLTLGWMITAAQAQPERWQQRVSYKMDIDFDVKQHQYKGKQNLIYINNSPDTLHKVFYHLYLNAFQPGSVMDVRSRTIGDPDPRVSSRIANLKPNEIGYQRIRSLTQNGQPASYEVEGTILEVTLPEPIMPHSSAIFDMEWDAQIPVQIRRNGRDSREGVAYSMAQWYPKLCEYDYQGWHANPYVGREFYGVWGDYDVKITIDKNFTIGGTGYLQNPDEIGHGYSSKTPTNKGDKLTWHFIAPNVHDFMWGADSNYTHEVLERKDGVILHFFYKKNDRTKDVWAALPKIMDKAFDFINVTYGQYPYRQYSFVQGGDGGMEYPMATLITGERPLASLVGVSVHELMHSWYQMLLGTNESLYAWMDEGFTTYASNVVMNHLAAEGLIPGMRPRDNPHANTYAGYLGLALSGAEEPMTIHADHFMTNFAYGSAAYNKGAVFLHQLEYIIGKQAFDASLLRYYYTWRFKHPNDNDCIRIFEKQSGLELDWYKEYWVHSTHTIDYAIKTVEPADNKATQITLERVGAMPMPLDVVITYNDGKRDIFNIPLDLMRGAKPQEDPNAGYTVLKDWPWTNLTYVFTIPRPVGAISKVEIDPSRRMADVNIENNVMGAK
ncbi:MAG TPA: M1 family metallopeptidase [Saprospiraceae bacterium]|nr:M1 family metallopeptidase [Saprospiraceae bacterium]HMP14603.1 M1 family metallopeptidase [Saprospiraceae bacterium]